MPDPVPADPPSAHSRAPPGTRRPGPADPGPASPRWPPRAGAVVDTPIGPLSLLAQSGRLIAGGFTADPAVMHARLSPPLRALPLVSAARVN